MCILFAKYRLSFSMRPRECKTLGRMYVLIYNDAGPNVIHFGSVPNYNEYSIFLALSLNYVARLVYVSFL